MSFEKPLVYDFWNEASCGEKLYFKGESEIEKYANQLTRRYELEPMILNFAEFEKLHNLIKNFYPNVFYKCDFEKVLAWKFPRIHQESHCGEGAQAGS